MLDKTTLENYNSVRSKHALHLLCHAPFTSLNFEQNGSITACCYNRSYVLGKYPQDTLRQTWFGDKAEQLRSFIRKNDLSAGCSACEEVLLSGNYQGTKAIYYDEYARPETFMSELKAKLGLLNIKHYPKVFEFELSNSCNLECTMCNGYFSSAIRKNREHLPAFRNWYDESFVEQLKDFIPHLSDAKFLGGEPFLIEIYYKIWDEVIRLNKDILLHITTNGTILNKKVKKYLEALRAGIVISIDSLNKERYEKIRVNASYDEVMENIRYFKDYTQRKGTYLSFAVCPIRSNWQDMPYMVQYCNENQIAIHFNTVWTPETESLRYLSAAELEAVIGMYQIEQFKTGDTLQHRNVKNFRDFTNQLEYWLEEKLQQDRHIVNWVHVFDLILTEDLASIDPLSAKILSLEKTFYAVPAVSADVMLPRGTGRGGVDLNPVIPAELDEQLKELYTADTAEDFLQAYFNSLIFFSDKALSPERAAIFSDRVGQLKTVVTEVSKKEELASELIRTGFLYHFNMFNEQPVVEILSLVRSRFR